MASSEGGQEGGSGGGGLQEEQITSGSVAVAGIADTGSESATTDRGSESARIDDAASESASSSANTSAVSGTESATSEAESRYDSVPAGESEQEAADRYCLGGYPPVKIADVISDRYHIVRKLGFGHFSTVWLAWDSKSPAHDPEFRALKISKSEKIFADATRTEIRILKRIANSDPSHPGNKFVCTILDDFITPSPHGEHVCMVQHCHGANLLHLIQRSDHKGLPLGNVKSITKQMLQGLHYLHDVCGIIHTDIKPENVLIEVSPIKIKRMAMTAVDMHKKGVKLPADFVSAHEFAKPGDEDVDMEKEDNKNDKSSAAWQFPDHLIKSVLQEKPVEKDPALEDCAFTIKIADFGNSCYTDKHYTYLIQTLPYRSLEVAIQAGYGPPADVWSTACVAFELATGDYLFDGVVGKRFAKTEDHLAHIIRLLGEIPAAYLRPGKLTPKFFTRCKLRKNHPRRFTPMPHLLTKKYHWPEHQAKAMADFLLPMLDYDQDRRATAKAASQHPYLEA